jgi:FkbM family methyltransferase
MARLNSLRGLAIAPLIESVGPVLFDVGAREGLDQDLIGAAWACTVVGFEPEPEEAKKLALQPDPRWGQVVIVPAAIGMKRGRAELHLPACLEGGSLLPHNEEMIELFGYEGLHRTERVIEVDAVTLDQALSETGVQHVDYLKLDIEGAELAVLKAGPTALKTCSAIKVEVSFLPQRRGQPLADEIVSFVRSQGFIWVDIRDTRHWRRRPLPPHPYIVRGPMPYSRGILAQTDLIFLRDLSAIETDAQAMRLVATAAALGYFDYAVTLMRQRPILLEMARDAKVANLEGALAQASGVLGRQAVRTAIWRTVRGMVPLTRSVMGLLPADTPSIPF